MWNQDQRYNRYKTKTWLKDHVHEGISLTTLWWCATMKLHQKYDEDMMNKLNIRKLLNKYSFYFVLMNDENEFLADIA